MGRRRHCKYFPTHPQLFPTSEESIALPEEALRETVRGLAELPLASLEVRVVKGGDDEPEDQA